MWTTRCESTPQRRKVATAHSRSRTESPALAARLRVYGRHQHRHLAALAPPPDDRAPITARSPWTRSSEGGSDDVADHRLRSTAGRPPTGGEASAPVDGLLRALGILGGLRPRSPTPRSRASVLRAKTSTRAGLMAVVLPWSLLPLGRAGLTPSRRTGPPGPPHDGSGSVCASR